MISDLKIYHLILSISAFAVSFIVTNTSLGVVKKISNRLGLLDYPNSRKLHSEPIARLGGVSIFLGFYCSVFVLDLLVKNFFIFNLNDYLFQLILLPLSLFFLLGLCDDIFKLSPVTRLIFQLSISSFAWMNGLRIENIDFSFFDIGIQNITLPSYLSLFLTIIWLSGITNAVNWLDGLDGLASSFSSITLFNFGIFCFLNGDFTLGLFSLIILGSCLGFLPKNISPAKIYMGDGGSYFLGFSLAAITLINPLSLSTEASYNQNQVNFIIPLIFLAVPIFDMLHVIFSRISEKKSPLYPDNRHIHHRLLKTDMNIKNTVFTICIISYWANSFYILLLNLQNKFLYFFIISAFCFGYLSKNLNLKKLFKN